jgi:hypothetical protein
VPQYFNHVSVGSLPPYKTGYLYHNYQGNKIIDNVLKSSIFIEVADNSRTASSIKECRPENQSEEQESQNQAGQAEDGGKKLRP